MQLEIWHVAYQDGLVKETDSPEDGTHAHAYEEIHCNTKPIVRWVSCHVHEGSLCEDHALPDETRMALALPHESHFSSLLTTIR